MQTDETREEGKMPRTVCLLLSLSLSHTHAHTHTHTHTHSHTHTNTLSPSWVDGAPHGPPPSILFSIPDAVELTKGILRLSLCITRSAVQPIFRSYRLSRMYAREIGEA